MTPDLEPVKQFCFTAQDVFCDDDSGNMKALAWKPDACTIYAAPEGGNVGIAYGNVNIQNIMGAGTDTLNPAATEYNCVMGQGTWDSNGSKYISSHAGARDNSAN